MFVNGEATAVLYLLNYLLLQRSMSHTPYNSIILLLKLFFRTVDAQPRQSRCYITVGASATKYTLTVMTFQMSSKFFGLFGLRARSTTTTPTSG